MRPFLLPQQQRKGSSQHTATQRKYDKNNYLHAVAPGVADRELWNVPAKDLQETTFLSGAVHYTAHQTCLQGTAKNNANIVH